MPCASSCEVSSDTATATTTTLTGRLPTPTQNTARPAALEPSTRMPILILIERTGSSGRIPIRRNRAPTRLIPRRSSRGVLERVADAVHGADQVGAELAAQRLDVAVDGTRAGSVGPAPHLGEEPLAGQHGPRPAGEVDQQVE